ncbi:hypothetical protein JAAARDRAFT_132305 [Jaapia argillacea MUCL 33604]|uniref:Clp1-like protein n=1 Tax=Jaapia argillacea MUCL 33604 TaxID=933084 RepID=A0A067Q2N3_9AGAM|nr:hypothetical protein JAAARDRAFT_132305 [Jaapia argillacea MUCL 33604]
MVDVKPEEEKVKSVMSVGLPRFLKKPEFKAVESEVIEGIDEGLKGVDVEFVRDCLEEVGPRMMQVLASVQAEPIRNALPKELSIIINDLSADLPTHMFAVYARQPSPPSSSSDAPRRRVTLFPIHNIVMASHCANLPRLSTEKPKTPEKVGEEVTVPVVPLCIPSPQTFPQLSAYLYTKRSDHLLASLLPCPPPQPFVFSSSSSSSPSDSPESHDAKLLAYAKKLAGTYTPNALLQHAMLINGLWRNVCALGVDEERLWCTLDLAWEVVLRAMALATGVEFA